ncbi:MAG: serine/threonine protein kinase [Acidiferrobacterales bacterium]|nr:serine/threonine protein kinase [Acidiferrobacterales bacterium]
MNDSVLAFQHLTPEQMLDAVENCGVRCDGRFLALNSYENRVYQIGVEDGAPVVAKFYRPERWTDEEILEEHQYTLELAEAEVPVIAPISVNKQRTLCHDASFRFSLYPCRGGRAPELDNSDHLEMLGRFVGRMHVVGASKSYCFRPAVSLDNYIYWPSQFLLEHHFIPSHVEEAWTSLIDVILRQVKNCYDRAGDVADLRLHGDLHHGNVLWTDDGPHVVDFDDARTGPAIQDIWMFLSGDRQYQTARLADFLDGYTRFVDFNPSELHLIEALRSMRMVYHAGWLGSRWQDPAFPAAFPWFNSNKYWEQLILDLKEQSALMDEEPLIWN